MAPVSSVTDINYSHTSSHIALATTYTLCVVVVYIKFIQSIVCVCNVVSVQYVAVWGEGVSSYYCHHSDGPLIRPFE